MKKLLIIIVLFIIFTVIQVSAVENGLVWPIFDFGLYEYTADVGDGEAMLWNNGDTMLWNNGDTMLWND